MQELGGSTARQIAQAGQWKYSIPWMSRSVYKLGLAGVRNLLFSMSLKLLLPGSSNFPRNSVFFRSFTKFMSSGFHDHCLRTGCKLVTGWQENCVVCGLFCMFIIMIVSISISFVVLLNCLYLNP